MTVASDDRLALLAAALLESWTDDVVSRALERLETPPVEPEGYMTAVQAAEYLACGVSRIYALAATGRLKHHKDGRRLLFRRTELDAFVAAGGAHRP